MMTNREYLKTLNNKGAVEYYYKEIVCKQCDMKDTELCKTYKCKDKVIKWLEEENDK